MTAGQLPAAPYPGLVPFGEHDAPFFFGRDVERRTAVRALDARPLTVLFGPSGAGKTSLLRAGVAFEIRRRALENIELGGEQGQIVVVHSGWRPPPVEGIVAAIDEAVTEQLDWSDGVSRDAPLADALAEATARGAETYLVLDQLEEYFLYWGTDPLGPELARALSRRDVRAQVLLSIREDSLGALDGWARRLPSLFQALIRAGPLDRARAREAIEGPLEVYAELTGAAETETIEPELVEEVLAEVSVGAVAMGPDAGLEAEPDARVEPAYLQLVMRRLWAAERTAGSPVLHLETLRRLGGAEMIVRRHLDDALADLDAQERDLASQAFRYLVTPSGARVAFAATDLAEYMGAPVEATTAVLEKLSRVRIVRATDADASGAPAFEVSHDVLAAAVLDWRTRREEEYARRAYEESGAVAAMEVTALRARLRIAVAACAALAVIVVVLVLLLAR